MATINVQFSDASETKIISYFGAPQDPSVYPNQGVVQTSDERWAAFFNAMPSSMQSDLPSPD